MTERDPHDPPTVEFSETQDLKAMDSQTGRRRRHTFSSDPAARARRPVEIGEVLRDKYIVEEVIGEGGVGVVVAAHNLELDERVALKFLRSDVMNDADIVARFAHEAKAAVAIKSEHVARVFDVGSTPKGVPFLVMEYLEGHDLSSELATRGTLQVKEAVEYALQTCDALAAAHAKNIVHRDIKPDNLFLVDTGNNIPIIKVLDFGISKAALTGSVFGTLLPSLTSGKLMGTPLYMSPEQIRSTDDVDARSDIWSLGTVLYELLAGVPAFEADSLEELWTRIKTGEPQPLVTRRLDMPEGLVEILHRCIRKDPADRYQNVAELAIALLPYGPKRARICAERASQVLWSAGLTQSRLRVMSTAPPPNPSDPNAIARDSRTSGASTGSLPALTDEQAGLALHVVPKPQKRRTLLAVGIAFGAVLIAALIGVLALHQSTPPASTSEAARSAQVPVPSPVQETAHAPTPTPIAAPTVVTEPKEIAPTPVGAAPAEPARPVATAEAPTPARTFVPRPATPVYARPNVPAAPPAPGKAKPKATDDEPDLGY